MNLSPPSKYFCISSLVHSVWISSWAMRWSEWATGLPGSFPTQTPRCRRTSRNWKSVLLGHSSKLSMVHLSKSSWYMSHSDSSCKLSAWYSSNFVAIKVAQVEPFASSKTDEAGLGVFPTWDISTFAISCLLSRSFCDPGSVLGGVLSIPRGLVRGKG